MVWRPKAVRHVAAYGMTELKTVVPREHLRFHSVMRHIGMRHERGVLLVFFDREPQDLPITVYSIVD